MPRLSATLQARKDAIKAKGAGTRLRIVSIPNFLVGNDTDLAVGDIVTYHHDDNDSSPVATEHPRRGRVYFTWADVDLVPSTEAEIVKTLHDALEARKQADQAVAAAQVTQAAAVAAEEDARAALVSHYAERTVSEA